MLIIAAVLSVNCRIVVAAYLLTISGDKGL